MNDQDPDQPGGRPMRADDAVVHSTLSDRRARPRLRAVDRRARLAWRPPGRPTTKVRGQLVNINEWGALIVSPTPAPTEGSFWLGLESLVGEWVRANHLASHVEGGQWSIRLAFCEPCPIGLLERATTDVREDSLMPGEDPTPFRISFDWSPT